MNVSVHSLMPEWLKLAVEWNIVGRDAPYYGLGFGMTKCLKNDRNTSGKSATGCGDPRVLPKIIAKRFVSNSLYYVSRIDNDTGGWLKSTRHDRALEFGCGLGRLALGWATQFKEVDCVDQSIYHQELATRPLLTRFTKELIQEHPEKSPLGRINVLITTPDLLRTADGHRYNFVHTVKVLQHILPYHQQVYLEQMCDVLRPGGKGWVHFQDSLQDPKKVKRSPEPCSSMQYKVGVELGDTASDPAEKRPQKNGWDRHGVMATYDFDTQRLHKLLLWRGCEVESILPVRDGPHGFRVIFNKRRFE
eukprot:CAMPEP_0119307166 /NCGR_PEP_ID=MMETSP1333-20130426/7735_1 /TAXON_ID=418940 /ORGANISM="Scyphosphaera apsteinii, Strain RCC1455" /LENGTH=304 /DNA_ID=CAMNT_0007310645 /DNA_START=158 /DNA_END=1072 /DNA_ORIENTATION=-